MALHRCLQRIYCRGGFFLSSNEASVRNPVMTVSSSAKGSSGKARPRSENFEYARKPSFLSAYSSFPSFTRAAIDILPYPHSRWT